MAEREGYSYVLPLDFARGPRSSFAIFAHSLTACAHLLRRNPRARVRIFLELFKKCEAWPGVFFEAGPQIVAQSEKETF